MKICRPNWFKDTLKLNVSSSLEQAIEKKKKKQLRFGETHVEDPYLQKIVLHNLHMDSIFGCNKPLDNECKRKVIWYQDKLWKSNVWIFWGVHLWSNIPQIPWKNCQIPTKEYWAIWSHLQFCSTFTSQRDQATSE